MLLFLCLLRHLRGHTVAMTSTFINTSDLFPTDTRGLNLLDMEVCY
jgi:hypothetical protein